MKENVDWYRQIEIKSMLTRHRLVYEKMFSRIGYENSKSVKILLAFFGSQYYYETLKRLHPHFDIYVVDDIHFKFAYTNISEDHLAFINIDECTRKNGKGDFFENEANKIFKLKFDYIFMNPPYDKNFHLKIVEQSIPMLTDDGILVNISPIRWLQDPLAKYKKSSDYCKFEESVVKHIEDVYVVHALAAQEVFSSGQYEDLGVYVIRKSAMDKVRPIIETLLEPKMNGLFDKVNLPTYQKKFVSIYDVRTLEGEPDYSRPFVKMSPLHGHPGCKDYADIISPNKEITMKQLNAKTGGGKMSTINFDTDEEANNLADSLQTTFMKACNYNCKTNMWWPGYAIPFMGDCINPRTGLKGYEGEWTDDDFCKYFGITDDEWNEIVETMKPYLQETIVEK